uniref:Uncharacterized protein n=1 Tax=Anopheles dirus TaxID=7168 RepID=A0A182NTV1_9DIPT
MFIFGIFYAWPEENMDKNALRWYRVKGILFRMFFIYLCTASQVAYNFTVTTREELFEGSFVLLTQLVLIMKMEFFYKNISKIQHLVRRLEGELYKSRNSEEDVPLLQARKKTTTFWTVYFIFSDGLVVQWLVIFHIYYKMIVPAWPTVDRYSPSWAFETVIFYQFFSILLNASFNISWDSLVAALLALTNAHLHRLEIQLKKVSAIIYVRPLNEDGSRVERKSNEDVYNDLMRCIVFHQELTGFLRDVLNLFGGPILAQLCCSVFILCITEFRLLTDVNTTEDIIRAVSYLMCLIIQVVQYCYFGNEVNYMSHKVHEATAFMNYPDMDIRTRKLLIAFQMFTSKGILCTVKKVFYIELSMATFVTIIKTSYSYLAVLRSMTD